jgi:hypothetical protein
LYWKDPRGILLNCLLKDEADNVLQEFHAGECGGHLNWKVIANKILRARFYWPTLFVEVHHKVSACHQCQLFEGKRKLLPLPLKSISIEALSSNGDWTSLEKYNPLLQASTGGFSLPPIILPNGLKQYQEGKPLTLLLSNSLKIISCLTLDVIEIL